MKWSLTVAVSFVYLRGLRGEWFGKSSHYAQAHVLVLCWLTATLVEGGIPARAGGLRCAGSTSMGSATPICLLAAFVARALAQAADAEVDAAAAMADVGRVARARALTW